jgi:hypothetical protein
LFEAVVEEREGVVLRERDEPEGQLGEVDGEGIFIDAVEAAFGDDAAGVEVGVFVGGNLRGGVVDVPGAAEVFAELAGGLDLGRRRSPWRGRRF